MIRPWRCPKRGTSEEVTDLAHAENRLRSIEKRAEKATRIILTRDDHNHWTETIRQTIHGERA